MKTAPPPPGWIDRLYRAGVGLAIPLTIVSGVVLLLATRERETPAPPAVRHAAVVMALPLEDARPTVELRPAPGRLCPPAAGDPRPCPLTAPVSH